MQLTKEKYIVSRETLLEVLKALENNWFSDAEGESYNNDDVIGADEALRAEINAQEES